MSAEVRTEEMLTALTADIVAAHVSNNTVEIDEVSRLIETVFGALRGLGTGETGHVEREPAVPIRASVKDDHLVCLEDGRRMKVLKRHLMSEHGLTPDKYRARWGLPADYPMTAPEYGERRSTLAKQIGLGRMPGQRGGRPRKVG